MTWVHLQRPVHRNRTRGWSGLIAHLTAKRQSAAEHIEQLRTQKRELALEAAMGSADAKKRLKEINTELARVALDVDDFDMALKQAEAGRGQAEQAAAEAAQREREAEMGKLARQLLKKAAEYTAAAGAMCDAAEGVKTLAHAMIALAKPEEMAGLNRLLEPAPYMRAAEHAGLRDHLEFRPYPGPREHVVALEEELALHLSRWITNAGGQAK